MSGQYPYPVNPHQQYPPPSGSSPALNPYAAPQADSFAATLPAPTPPGKFPGLWREGNVLVMHKLAPLPDICLLSNRPAQRLLKRKLQWHHPAISLTILITVPLYIVLALVLTKRATIQLPLTDEWYERRQRRLIFAWGTGLTSLSLMVLGFVIAAVGQEPGYLLLVMVGLVGGIASLIMGQELLALVKPKRITDEYIWLKGVHPDFLDRLDVWPYRI
jgi:hypothetical protein